MMGSCAYFWWTTRRRIAGSSPCCSTARATKPSTAADGAAALEILEHEKDIDAVVSDVRMPKIDGFQLCRTIRNDPRWAKLPFIFYSSIFIGDPAKTFGRDLGATAYLDAKDIAPDQVAKELERLVNQHVRDEYDETLGRLIDDVEFARRYHNVVLGSLDGAGAEDVRDLVATSAKALDDVVSRLDAEKRSMAEAQRTVKSAELQLLKELGEYLGDRDQQPAGRHPRQRPAAGDARPQPGRQRGRRTHRRRREQDK